MVLSTQQNLYLQWIIIYVSREHVVTSVKLGDNFEFPAISTLSGNATLFESHWNSASVGSEVINNWHLYFCYKRFLLLLLFFEFMNLQNT